MSLPLRVMGWEPFTEEMLAMVERHPRIVMVYPHNSMYDFWLSMFYIRAHPLLRRRTRTLVNRKFMGLPVIGGILRQWGCISGAGRDRGMSTFGKLVSELQGMEEFILPIAPKGDIVPRPWRSGYYEIARQTGAFVLAAGFDYHRHRYMLGVPFDITGMSREEVDARCKREMAYIPSVNLRHLEFPHHQHQVPLAVDGVTDQIYVRNMSVLFLLVLFLLVLLLARKYNEGR